MRRRFEQLEFQCPGEPARISRAVHLARLTQGYPACRKCAHRHDVDGLSQRLQRKIPPGRRPKTAGDFLTEAGFVGNLHEGFDAALAGRFATGFALVLREDSDATARYPRVAVAGDGRPVTQRHFAAALESLLTAGCHLVEIGSVPCPALAWAVMELDLDGGLYLGNPHESAHQAGLRFFGRSGIPLSGAERLGAIGRWAETEPGRPVRRSGRATKADVLPRYESRLHDSFHGLRPLRFHLHTTCRPAGTCLERLLRSTACKMVWHESPRRWPSAPISDAVGHFALAIDDDGRRCRLWDERGAPVSFQRLFRLVAGMVRNHAGRERTVVVDEDLPAAFADLLDRSEWKVHRGGTLPSAVHSAMTARQAVLGADGAGRIWYGEAGGHVGADALGTAALVLGKLSEGDRPLSEVLDAEVPSQ